LGRRLIRTRRRIGTAIVREVRRRIGVGLPVAVRVVRLRVVKVHDAVGVVSVGQVAVGDVPVAPNIIVVVELAMIVRVDVVHVVSIKVASFSFE